MFKAYIKFVLKATGCLIGQRIPDIVRGELKPKQYIRVRFTIESQRVKFYGTKDDDMNIVILYVFEGPRELIFSSWKVLVIHSILLIVY